jgi:hypothetical protein
LIGFFPIRDIKHLYDDNVSRFRFRVSRFPLYQRETGNGERATLADGTEHLSA